MDFYRQLGIFVAIGWALVVFVGLVFFGELPVKVAAIIALCVFLVALVFRREEVR